MYLANNFNEHKELFIKQMKISVNYISSVLQSDINIKIS